MATVYVDDAGSDAYTYVQAQSIGTPWAGWQKCNTSATTGDTIQTLPGTYTSSQMNVGYTLSKAFNFYGYSAPSLVGGVATWTTIIDAANAAWGIGPQSVDMSIAVKNIEFRNVKATTSGGSYYIMGLNGGAAGAVVNWTVDHCKWKTFGAMNGYAMGGVMSSNLSNTHGNFDVSYCIFDDIYDSQIDGVGSQIFGIRNLISGKTIKFYNNTIYLPRTTAAELVDGIWRIGGGSGSTLTWKNNIVHAVTSTPFYALGSFTSPTVSYNDHYNVTSVPSGTGNLTTDPLLVCQEQGCYELQNNGVDIISPCIDTGISTI